MAKFFIHRPIFAWVVAIIITVIGLISINKMPITHYPKVAPPTINLRVIYPGVTAQIMEETVLTVIENEMNGAKGLIFMNAQAESNGTAQINLSFEVGTDPDMAQVDIQNRLARATPKLPATVNQYGIDISQSTSNFAGVVSLISKNPNLDIDEVKDYANKNIIPELQKISGVGSVQLFASGKALRVWLDLAKLQSFNLSIDQINSAIRSQNLQVTAGSLGGLPAVENQGLNSSVVVKGQLENVEQFKKIILRSNLDGSAVRLEDVAKVEMGLGSYNFSAKFNGQENVAIGIQTTAEANLLRVNSAVVKQMKNSQKFFPEGMEYVMPLDTSTFVKEVILKVFRTLLEGVVLVFLVMFLFLQKFRYTIIPTIVVPVTLLGTMGVLLILGFSINILTMIGLVLVIGIVVDDAIVVVENVERIMSEEGLAPIPATLKAMSQISGAIIGITVVLISVFIPLAFFPGATGNIYRQFSVTMATAIAFSAFFALTLTPALCATLLKPIDSGHHEKTGFFGWFNRAFYSSARNYESWLVKLLRRSGRMIIIYLMIITLAVWAYKKMPTSFLPNEDQGFVLVTIQLPSGATAQRTSDVINQVKDYMQAQEEVESIVSVQGFSFSGAGQNTGMAFVILKDLKERTKPENSVHAFVGRAFGSLSQIKDAFIYPLSPPSIPSLGIGAGVSFVIQDRNQKGRVALLDARNQFLGMASQSSILTQVRPDGMENEPQLHLDIDREKIYSLGLTYDGVARTLSTALGSSYVSDYPSGGKLNQVIVQADEKSRMQIEQLLDIPILNNQGKNILLSAVASTRWETGPAQVKRYNGYPAMAISAGLKPGFSSGEAMQEVENLMQKLPEGFGFEWTEQSREEVIAGSQSLVLYLFALLAIFLCLAALYESWSIPFAVMLVVPLGVIGVILSTMVRGMDNDVYFQIGLITIIGLSAKNAILIIEFAKDAQVEGKSLIMATLDAAHRRFRPILMTSMAFTFGVLPLYFATGVGAASERAIGTGVIGGMITGTIFAIIFVPVFFVLVRSFFSSNNKMETENE